MLCPSCKAHLEDFWKFCESCGTPTPHSDAIPPNLDSNLSVPEDSAPMGAMAPELSKTDFTNPASVEIAPPTTSAFDSSESQTTKAGKTEKQESSQPKPKYFVGIAVALAVALGGGGIVVGLGIGQTIEDNVQISASTTEPQEGDSTPDEEGEQTANRDMMGSTEEGEPESGEAPTGLSPDAVDTPKAESEISAEQRVAGTLDEWVKFNARLKSSFLMLGGLCKADFCVAHEVELRYADPQTIGKQEILISFSPPRTMETSQPSMSLLAGTTTANFLVIEREPMNVRDYQNLFSVEVTVAGATQEARLTFRVNELDVSTFASEVLRPIKSLVDDFKTPIPGLEELKSRLIAEEFCELFQPVDNSGWEWHDCYNGNPNSVLSIAATGPSVLQTTLVSWAPSFTVYGPGWAVEVRDPSLRSQEKWRDLGAVFFRSALLNCDLNVAPPNYISQCLSFTNKLGY